MLVLSRRVGERLVIGDDIVVTVIEVRSDGVKLGIDAPRHVRVHRAEVLDAVTAANVDAVAADDSTAAALRKLVPATPAPPASPAQPTPDPSSGASPDR
ncbi:carbon storage regulator CsrA [Cellulomonas sp. URHB0016]